MRIMGEGEARAHETHTIEDEWFNYYLICATFCYWGAVALVDGISVRQLLQLNCLTVTVQQLVQTKGFVTVFPLAVHLFYLIIVQDK